MTPLVMYHANCADGFGAAFAAWLKLGYEAEYFPIQYGTVKSAADVNKLPEIGDREVYILDFSLPKDVMDWLFTVSKKVVWLDHHKTAFEMWCGGMPESQEYQSCGIDALHRILLDNSKSGAVLAWRYFHPDVSVPMLIRHIDDYDRWQFKEEQTEPFIKALWSYAPWSFEQWEQEFLSLGEADDYQHDIYWRFIAEGTAILRAHEQNVKAVVAGAASGCKLKLLLEDETGKYAEEYFEGLMANCPPHLTSAVGHELANRSGTYGLLWHINKEGKCICSLRSNDNYDVSRIAKSFGGGGHKTAAGFEAPIDFPFKVMLPTLPAK